MPARRIGWVMERRVVRGVVMVGRVEDAIIGFDGRVGVGKYKEVSEEAQWTAIGI